MATAFLDETGIISKDRFFAIGCLKLPEPSRLLRKIQKWRDKEQWYKEIKWTNITKKALPLYEEIVDILGDQSDARFFCFVADRDTADPIERFGTSWDAYGKLAEQLIVAITSPQELIAVLADNYSTPDHILFEEELRQSVNRRLRRLAVVSSCRLDSRSSDGLQVVDLLTSATAHEFRHAAGLASNANPKAALADHVRDMLGSSSNLGGWQNASHSVRVYEHGAWSPA